MRPQKCKGGAASPPLQMTQTGKLETLGPLLAEICPNLVDILAKQIAEICPNLVDICLAKSPRMLFKFFFYFPCTLGPERPWPAHTSAGSKRFCAPTLNASGRSAWASGMTIGPHKTCPARANVLAQAQHARSLGRGGFVRQGWAHPCARPWQSACAQARHFHALTSGPCVRSSAASACALMTMTTTIIIIITMYNVTYV